MTVSSSRRKIMLLMICLCLLVYGAQLVNIQIIKGPQMAAQARAERSRTYTIRARRGDILDSTGKAMATSVKRYNLGVNQKLINTYEIYDVVKHDKNGRPIYRRDKNNLPIVKEYGPAAAAKKLAPLLDTDPIVLGGKMVAEPGKKPSTFVYIAKNITPQLWTQIRDLRIPGIEPEEISKRIYPNDNTAGNIVGFTDAYDKGLAGLELSQEKILAGIDGKASMEIGRLGQIIPVADRWLTPAQAGWDINTSINLDLQNLCQEALDKTVKQSGAQSATAVVEQVGTGRIIALCDSDTVNPKEPTKTKESARGSRAVSTVYEPGSSMKAITMAISLDHSKLQAGSTFNVPFTMTMPGGQTFRDSSDHAHWRLTAAGVIAKSSNVGIVQVGDLVKDSLRYEKLTQIGFGKPTGIELPGEASGILAKDKDWDGRQRYTIMFGQGMAATILQVNSAIATLANEGKYVPPHLIDSWKKSDGTVEKKQIPQPKQIFTPQTSKLVLQMMEGVTSKDGTAPKAKIDGYRIAGKTGTTQILTTSGQQVGTEASFTGVIPANDPKVVITVVVNKPSSSIYGAVVAVPPFLEIATAAVRELGIQPDSSQPQLLPIGTY